MSPRPFPNLVIRASAGTGKTHQLSNRFLGLAAAGVPPDSILATTFTRKAAGEILGRVLLRLAEAAGDPDKLQQLAENIKTPLDRPRCLAILAGMVRHLHRLRVSTLDSFFLQVARSFSLELGLPPGWQIASEVEESRLRAEAVRAVVERQSTGDLLGLMHLLTKGEAARSVSEQIGGLVAGLYSVYLESPSGAWDALPRKKGLTDDELREAIDALEAVELPADKRFQNAHRKAVESARAGDWLSLVTKGLAAKIADPDGDLRFCNKPIPPGVCDAYRRLIDHAQADLLNRIANQTQATRRLLEHFDAAYRSVKLARRALRFEDVTRMVGQSALDQRWEEIVYRLDAHVAHLLLDEFQDTSPPQWRVLAAFARRVADGSPGRSFFCVGDVKQAIYGWRGGEAEIFDAIEQELPGLSAATLDESRRCGPAVIDTVNRAFENLSQSAVLGQDKYRPAAEAWGKRFRRHATARSGLPGYCRLVAAPAPNEGEEQQVVTWRFAAEEVDRMHREAPGFSIGVLVRRNSTVAQIMYNLRQLGIHASEEGGNPLSDSPPVELILSLLTLADHPGHTAARFHVAQSPLGARIGLDRHDDDEAACRLARDIRRNLIEDGYGPTIEGWAAQLAAHCDARDQRRLVQLVEMAYAYESAATLRADDFVAAVRQTRVEDPRGAEVRVMTVHQAKGLEFDVVVLPELDVRLIGQPPQVVVSRPGPAQPMDRVLRYVGQDLRPLLPKAFREMFDQHDRRAVEEALCVLYVAMTRAAHALHLVVNPSSASEKSLPATMAGVLRAALTDGKRLEPGTVGQEDRHSCLSYEVGDPDWFRRVEAKRAEAAVLPEEAAAAPLRVELAPAPKRPTRGLERRSPSQLEGGARVSLAQRLQLDTARSLQRGTLIHAWFQEIEWLDQGEPSDQRLREVAAACVAWAEFDVTGALALLRRALEAPAIRAALTRATYQKPAASGAVTPIHSGPGLAAPRWEVWRERAFVLREEDTILSGSIDRLVALYDGDRAVGADVIDFKTDVVPPDDPAALAARIEYYRPQLAAYRRAAARLLGLDPGRVSARIVFTELGIVEAI